MKNPYECDIIKKLLEIGIELTLTQEGVRVGGFYKSGTVLLRPPTEEELESDPTLKYVAVSRYEEQEDIHTFGDLAYLNAYWLEVSLGRGAATGPSAGWEEVLLEKGLIRKKMVPKFTMTSRR